MADVSVSKHHYKFLIGSVAYALLLAVPMVLLSLYVFNYWFGLNKQPLSSWVPGHIPALDVEVELIDSKGIALKRSSFFSATPTKNYSRAVEKTHNSSFSGTTTPPQTLPFLDSVIPLSLNPQQSLCKTIILGDLSATDRTEKIAPNCLPKAQWKVISHPLSFSAWVVKPKTFWRWLSRNKDTKAVVDSPVFSGAIAPLLDITNIRGEDLGLKGVQGPFFTSLLQEAITNNAELHFDHTRGKNGFIFGFGYKKRSLLASTLPQLVNLLSHRVYHVSGLVQPVVLLQLGRITFFLTQFNDRFYLSGSLESLLNFLDQFPFPPSASGKETSLITTLRLDSLDKQLVSQLSSESKCHVNLSWSLRATESTLLGGSVSPNRVASDMLGQTLPAIYSTVPSDVFFGLITSLVVPLDIEPDAWNSWLIGESTIETDIARSALHDRPRGLALIWDIDQSTLPHTQIGLAFAVEPKMTGVLNFKDRFQFPELTSVCAEGSIFLAATNKNLLKRMFAACESQEPGLLDQINRIPEELNRLAILENPLFSFVNLSRGAAQAFEIGLRGETDLRKNRAGETVDNDYQLKLPDDEETISDLRRKSLDTLNKLPTFAVYGRTLAPADTSLNSGIILKSVSLPEISR